VLTVIASLWAVTTPLPDVLVAGDGQTAAIRGGDGRLAVLHSNRDSFAIKEWLAADGDARTVKDATLHDGVQCDAAGCIGRLSDGRLASQALSAEAFAEDCARAAVVVSPREAPGDCAATLIDRRAWRTYGAVALRWTIDRFELNAARPPGYERPWARAPREPASTALAPQRGRPHPTQRRARKIWKLEINPLSAHSRESGNPECLARGPRFRGDEGQRNQYRLNSPTSLPWMRTRLGGRMRTS
jgi:competence protein ComEC